MKNSSELRSLRNLMLLQNSLKNLQLELQPFYKVNYLISSQIAIFDFLSIFVIFHKLQHCRQFWQFSDKCRQFLTILKIFDIFSQFWHFLQFLTLFKITYFINFRRPRTNDRLRTGSSRSHSRLLYQSHGLHQTTHHHKQQAAKGNCRIWQRSWFCWRLLL